MPVTKYERFADPFFLKQIGRPLLERFLRRFEPALAGRNVLLPPPGALDHEFFNVLAHMLMSPEGLPPEMNEAIHVINEMSTAEGQQRIEELIRQSGARIEFDEESSRADIAMQLFLSAPELLARARDMCRLSRLSTFHHFAVHASFASNTAGAADLDRVTSLETACDAWFARHSRGRKNTRIDVWRLPAAGHDPGAKEIEYWFLIRHGDTFTRAPRIERGRTDVLHFRPAKIDVVVYNPARKEIRINARTLGERDLYRAAFGEHIFGDAGAFSDRKKYTLAPLVSDGADALDVSGVPEIRKAVLRGIEAALPGASAPSVVGKSSDLFAAIAEGLLPGVLPPGTRLVQAAFDLYFDGGAIPRSIQLRPPNTLRLSRHAISETVERWLAARGFCTLHREKPSSAAARHNSFAQ